MTITTSAIILRSELNPWIYICIVPDPYEDFSKVKDLVEKAWDDWWDNNNDEPIGDYIKRMLDDAGRCYDIYYANAEEDEL